MVNFCWCKFSDEMPNKIFSILQLRIVTVNVFWVEKVCNLYDALYNTKYTKISP